MKQRSLPRQARDRGKKGRYIPPSLVRYGNLKKITLGLSPEGPEDNPTPWIGTMYS